MSLQALLQQSQGRQDDQEDKDITIENPQTNGSSLSQLLSQSAREKQQNQNTALQKSSFNLDETVRKNVDTSAPQSKPIDKDDNDLQTKASADFIKSVSEPESAMSRLAKSAESLFLPIVADNIPIYSQFKKTEKARDLLDKGVKNVLNSETGQKVTRAVPQATSNLGLKYLSMWHAYSGKTYDEAYQSWLKSRNNPENNTFEKFLFDLQDSGLQSLLGVVVGMGTTYATKNPNVGLATSGLFYSSLSAEEQFQERGQVESLGNIAIDTVGDSILNTALLGIFKQPAGAVSRVLFQSQIEGMTEVSQTLIKYGNDYRNAKTSEEKQRILEEAKYYVTSGGIVYEHALGSTIGLVSSGGVELTQQSQVNKVKTSIESSEALNIQESIESGDIERSSVYRGDSDILQPKFAQGRISDVSQKLAKLDPALAAQYESEIDVNKTTMEEIVAKGLEVLDNRSINNQQFVPSKPKKITQPETVTEALAVMRDPESDSLDRADAVGIISDYTAIAEDRTVFIPNIQEESAPPLLDVRVTQFEDGQVGVKYTAEAGTVSTVADYDFTNLFKSPKAASDYALEQIQKWAEIQKKTAEKVEGLEARLDEIIDYAKNPREPVPKQKIEEQVVQAKKFEPNDLIRVTDKKTGKSQERIVKRDTDQLVVFSSEGGIPRKLDRERFTVELIEKNSPKAKEVPKGITFGEIERMEREEEAAKKKSDTSQKPKSKKTEKKVEKETVKTKDKKGENDKKELLVKSNEQVKNESTTGKELTRSLRITTAEKADSVDFLIGGETKNLVPPKQLINKTQAKSLFDKGVDELQFTVVVDPAFDFKTNKALEYKTEKTQLYIKPSAFGLIEDNLQGGDVILLKKDDLKEKGTAFRILNENGNPVAFLGFNRPKQPSDDVHALLMAQIGVRNRVLRNKRYLTPKVKKYLSEARVGVNELNFDRNDMVTLYRNGRLNRGDIDSFSTAPFKDGSSKAYRVPRKDVLMVYDSDAWWNITQKATKGNKELYQTYKHVLTTMSRGVDKGEVLVKTSRKYDRILEKERSSFSLFSMDAEAMKNETDSHFATVSQKVRRAEPENGKPSRFLSRVPENNPDTYDNLDFNPPAAAESSTKNGELEIKKLAKRHEIAAKLAHKLNVPVKYGKFRAQGALGIYKPDSQTVRLSSRLFGDREGGQLTTLVHEVGHFLDYTTKPFSTMIAKDEQLKLVQEYGDKNVSKNAKRLREEAFAEFLRFWITQPEKATKLAPNFTARFEEEMAALPEVRDTLVEARTDFKRWSEQDSQAKILAQTSFNQSQDLDTLSKKAVYRMNKLFESAGDDLHFIGKYTELYKDVSGAKKISSRDNPYVLARTLRGWMGRARSFLEYGTSDVDIMKDGKVAYTGKSLKEVLQPIEDIGALYDFSGYLVARRSIELDGRGIQTGIKVADSITALKKWENQYPIFKQAAEDIDGYQDRLMGYARESGLINNKQYAQMKELNKVYVPFFRVREELNERGFVGSSIAGGKSITKKIKGSDLAIVDPLESIIKNTYTIISASERNNILRAMARMAGKEPQVAQLFEKVPVDQVKVATVNAKEIAEQALGVNTELGKMFNQEGVEVADQVPEAMINIFRPSFVQKGSVVTVMEKGKPQYYDVDPDIYGALNNLEREDMNMLVELMSYPAQFLRAGATLAPEFMIRNPLRDTVQAAIYSKYGFIPLYDTTRGLFELVRKGDAYQAWLAEGGDMATLVSVDRKNLKISKDELVKWTARAKRYLNPLETLRAFSSMTEIATRLGEMKRALERGADAKEAAFAAREVALDFNKMGAKIRIWNRLAAFANVTIQDNIKLVNTFRKNPYKATFLATTYLTLPSVLLYMINRDEEGWDEIPQWQKDIFWLIKVDDTWYRIPKPFGVGILFGSAPERALEYMDKKDPESMAAVAQTFITGAIPGLIPTGMEPILENITNYDFFLKRPIVSRAQENLPAEDQYNARTSEAAKILGEVINYSPAKIDNLVQGYFAGLGRYATDGVDAVLKGTGITNEVTPPAKEAADMPLLKAFVIRDPVTSGTGESVNDFYEKRDAATKAHNKIKLLSEEGKVDELRAYMVEHPEAQMYTYYNRIANDLADIRKARTAIYDSETLTAEQKREKINKLNEVMTNLAARAIEIELK